MGLGFGASKFPVIDGMTFWFDFCNRPQYPRTAFDSNNFIDDKIQGLPIKLNGANAPFSIQGTKWFRMNGNEWLSVENGSNQVPMDGECTLVMVLYRGDIVNRRTIFEKAGTTNNSYEQEIAVTWETDETLTWYSRVSTYDFGSTSSIGSSDGPTMVGIKMSTGKISGVARRGWYSINGAPWIENYTSRSTNTITPAGQIRIGNGYAGIVGDHPTNDLFGINQCMIWNRQLSDAEIQTVYQSVREYVFGL